MGSLSNCNGSKAATDFLSKGARGWNLKQAVDATGSTYVKSSPTVAAGVITIASKNIKVTGNNKSSFSLILKPTEASAKSATSAGSALNWNIDSSSECLKVDLC